MSPSHEVLLSRHQNFEATPRVKAPETSGALKNNFYQKAKKVVVRVGLATSILTAGVVLPDVLSPEPAEAATVPCGTVLVAGKDWLGGQGVDTHSNGTSQSTGNSCAGNKEVYNLSANPSQYGFGWQCVELVNRLYAARGWYPRLWLGPETNYGAKNLYTYAAQGKYQGLVAKANGSGYIPSPGDMIVHSNGDYGHVAVVDRIEGTSLIAVEQNSNDMAGNPTGWAKYGFDSTTGTISKPNTTISGFIHAEKNTLGTNTPAPVDLPTFVPDIVQRPDGETDIAVVGPGNSLDFYYNRPGSTKWSKLAVAVGGYAFSSPDMIQRPNGETNIAVVGPDNSLDFYINKPGSPAWGKLTVAGPKSAYSKPAIVQRPSGETDIAVRGPDNSLNFYYNLPGSPSWGKIPVATSNQAYSAPAMIQRPNGETDIAVQGPENSLNFYFNKQGSPYWGMSRVAINGWAHSAPAIVQRTSGETDIAVQGPSNSLDFYFNQQGSPYWGRIRAAGNNTTFSSPNAPAMVQRSKGETDIAVRGPGDSADFYINAAGSSVWSKLPIAINGYSQRTPAMIQRLLTGETDLAIVGPSNRLDFYINQLGSPAWGNLPISGSNSAS